MPSPQPLPLSLCGARWVGAYPACSRFKDSSLVPAGETAAPPPGWPLRLGFRILSVVFKALQQVKNSEASLSFLQPFNSHHCMCLFFMHLLSVRCCCVFTVFSPLTYSTLLLIYSHPLDSTVRGFHHSVKNLDQHQLFLNVLCVKRLDLNVECGTFP